MKLNDILKGCDPAGTQDIKTLGSTEITAISCDSRQAGTGSLFIAVQGHVTDGHNYIAMAFEKGAAAVVAQHIPDGLPPEHRDRIILVQDTRKATALAAANFFGHPSRDMVVVGITGTNGKTTTSWIMESIFTASGFCTGVIGTVNIRYPGKTMDNPTTTPDGVSLQKTLAEMKKAGVTHVIMEVSSHSLDQYRVLGCEFNAGIFTNLTQDHLDYHQTLDEYFLCKKKLFTDYLDQAASGKTGTAVVNIDDEYGDRLAQSIDYSMFRVGISGAADISAKNIKDEISGLCADLDINGSELPITSPLTGRFNLENILCAAGAALAVNVSHENIIKGIATLNRVPGRLEKLDTDLNRHIFVDYAHTPDALASILETLSHRAPARLITVFGCGGDRDRTKRPLMGKMACQYSDIAIATSDNPRSESPDAIVADIIEGIKEDNIPELDPENIKTRQRGYIREVDRAKALDLAVKISRPEDIIVAAGKGHETYQITNAGTIHFDDMEHLAAACDRLTTPMDWCAADLEKALGTESAIKAPDNSMRFSTIETDSRTIEPGMIFLALAGETFDGHDFIPELVKKGISAFVVKSGFLASLSDERRKQMIRRQLLLFETKDTQIALGKLAHFQRMRSNVKIIAVTGSNGKTTTRKMTREIFAKKFDVLATKGNFNNEIGMPLTLLKLAPVHEWAVIEMGMNHPGEISRLSAIARPDIALITNTSGAHLEGLKTADNVARAKSEVFEGLRKNSTALLFSDDPRRKIMETHARANKNITKVLFFGQNPDADIQGEDVEVEAPGLSFSVRSNGQTARFRVNSPARFMVNNALAAMGAALIAGIDIKEIQSGLAAFTPVRGRMNLGRLSNGVNLIDDTYNANPASMSQALKTLDQVAGRGRGMAALGDMLELGPNSEKLHRKIGFLVADLAPARVCLFGTQAAHIESGALEKGYPKEKLFMGTKDEIARILAQELTEGCWLLLKGSRGMAMETLVPVIENLIKRERKAE